MRVLFVQKSAFPSAGVMSLAAVVKKAGWQADLVLPEEENIFKKVGKLKPEIVALPVFTGEHQWVLETARKLKRQNPKIFILLGGPHPTYYPEIIKAKGIDAVIRGEAEGAILDLLNALEKKRPLTKIKNLWWKKGKKIYKNPLRPLIEDLDLLPLPDREIYYKYDFLRKASVKQFLSSRGCPYACTFCSNHLLRKMYKNKGRYLRRHSPQRMIKEIKEVYSKYGFETVSFSDDVFTAHKDWLMEFLPIFKKEIGVPFMVNVTAHCLDEELARMLAKAGCWGIAMGVESGSQEIRFEVLKKFITNEQIIESGKLAKKYGLKLKTYNILSLPGETLKEAWETVKINQMIKPDSATASLLQPFPGYEITSYAQKYGFLPRNFDVEDVGESIYLSSPINSPQKRELENLQRFFPLVVEFPWMGLVVERLIKLPPNPIFTFLGRAFYGLFMSRVHHLTWGDAIRYLRHMDPFKV